MIAMMGYGYGMFSFFLALFFIIWVGVVAYVLVLLTRMSKSLERIALRGGFFICRKMFTD